MKKRRKHLWVPFKIRKPNRGWWFGNWEFSQRECRRGLRLVCKFLSLDPHKEFKIIRVPLPEVKP